MRSLARRTRCCKRGDAERDGFRTFEGGLVGAQKEMSLVRIGQYTGQTRCRCCRCYVTRTSLSPPRDRLTESLLQTTVGVTGIGRDGNNDAGRTPPMAGPVAAQIIAGIARVSPLRVPTLVRPAFCGPGSSLVFSATEHVLGGFGRRECLDLYAGSGALGLERSLSWCSITTLVGIVNARRTRSFSASIATDRCPRHIKASVTCG